MALGTDESFDAARKIYNNGGNSKSFAQITITPGLTKNLLKGGLILGKNEENVEVAGKAGEAYSAGTTNLKIYYSTTDIQANYMNCQVGGLESPNLKGCFKQSGDFDIDGETYTYTYEPLVDNRSDRTM